MNETSDVRPGEELDRDALARFLLQRLGVSDPVEISQFPAGSSNLTYLIRIAGDEYVLRRPPFGNTVKTAHDMRREFDVLSKLSPVYPPAPKPFLFCDDESIIGAEFYLMERRKGLIIRGSVGGANADISRRQVSNAAASSPDNAAPTWILQKQQSCREEVCDAFIRNLADLHALDYASAGLSGLGKPEGYPGRQVEGWTNRYYAAKTHEHPPLEATIRWLNGNIPAESGASIVHNDYKFDNVMLDPNDLTKITAVLDWEMVTIGDPLMDLGTTLGYWMSADAGEEMMRMPFNPYILMANISRQQLVEMYAAASGRDVSNMLYYYVFGTFKIAVIAQQIYARFEKGFTTDQRFAGFDKFVGKLGSIADSAIVSGRI